MPDQCAQNTGVHPKKALVDAGYCSETNLEAAKERQLACGTDTFMATGRLAHDEQAPPAPRGRIPRAAERLRTTATKIRHRWGIPGSQQPFGQHLRAAREWASVLLSPVRGRDWASTIGPSSRTSSASHVALPS